MNSGEISGNTGGGVEVDTKALFIKTGGTITAYTSDKVNGNVAQNSFNYYQSNKAGHAVRASGAYRKTTARPGVNLDSSKEGSAGGWE